MSMLPRGRRRPAPAPPVDAVREHFDAWNEAWRSGGFDEIDPEIRERGELLLDGLKAVGPARPRILEVGCGTGWLAERLAPWGPVTGVDLSPRAIEIARLRPIAARFLAADFQDLDFEDQRFDVVVCVETLFYVPDAEACLDKIADLMPDGGWLGLSCINRYVYERSSDIGPAAPGQPRNWMSGRDLRRLIGRRFEVKSVRTVGPRGDRGLLRIVNSHKLNAVLGRLFAPRSVRRAKERVGLGGGLVILARRRPA